MIEQGSSSHIFGKGFQLHLKLSISLGRLKGKGADTVEIASARLQGHEGDVRCIRQFVGSTEGLLIKIFPVGVIHSLLGILEHIAISRKGSFYLVAKFPSVGLRADALKLSKCFFQSACIQ